MEKTAQPPNLNETPPEETLQKTQNLLDTSGERLVDEVREHLERQADLLKESLETKNQSQAAEISQEINEQYGYLLPTDLDINASAKASSYTSKLANKQPIDTNAESTEHLERAQRLQNENTQSGENFTTEPIPSEAPLEPSQNFSEGEREFLEEAKKEIEGLEEAFDEEDERPEYEYEPHSEQESGVQPELSGGSNETSDGQDDSGGENRKRGGKQFNAFNSAKNIVNSAKKTIQAIRSAVLAGQAALGIITSFPVWGPIVGGALVLLVIVVIFVAAIFIPLDIIGGGSGEAEAADTVDPGTGFGGPPGSGTTVTDEYCQEPPPCSTEFKNIIEAAASWAQIPGGVLVTVGLRESATTFSLTDDEIRAASAPSASMTPCPVNPTPVSTGEHATGPMQFIFSTWSGNSYFYGNAVTNSGVVLPPGYSRPGGYTGEMCNVLDAYFAGAKYIKTLLNDLNGTTPFDQPVRAWTREELRYVLFNYGSCTSGDEDCVTALYERYLVKSQVFVGDGTTPTGWPTSGAKTQGPYCAPFSSCTSHATLAAVDIASGSSPGVFATQSGILEVGDSGDPSIIVNADGSVSFDPVSLNACRARTRFGCTGLYAAIIGGQYTTIYMHLDRTQRSSCLDRAGQAVMVGSYLGVMGTTGYSTGPHTHYEVRLNSGSPVPNNPTELNRVFPPEWGLSPATITNSLYSGTACLQ